MMFVFVVGLADYNARDLIRKDIRCSRRLTINRNPPSEEDGALPLT